MKFCTHVSNASGDASRRQRLFAKTIMVALLLGGLSTSLAQSLQPARSVIGLEQVVASLAATKLPLESAEVSLLAQNIAMVAAPRLQVRKIEAVGAQDARVRMACEAQEQCLPFYVAIHWADESAAQAALHLSGGVAPGTARVMPSARPAVRPARVQTSDALSPASTGESLRGAGSPNEQAHVGDEESVRAGSHATLLIDAERLHIKVPVICLEKGTPGRRIRVTALDHKQTFLAEVVDGTLLKGTL